MVIKSMKAINTVIAAVGGFWGLAIAPVQAESVNIQFTGIVSEQVSVDISSPQSNSVEIATSGTQNIQIPKLSTTRSVSVNSTQPVSIVVTSQGNTNQVITSQVITSQPATGKIDFKLPGANNSSSNTEQITITIVPQ